MEQKIDREKLVDFLTEKNFFVKFNQEAFAGVVFNYINNITRTELYNIVCFESGLFVIGAMCDVNEMERHFNVFMDFIKDNINKFSLS